MFAGSRLSFFICSGIGSAPAKSIYFADGGPAEFPTPSGKIEFYSTELRDKGFDPVPKYRRPPDPPPGSFRLLYGRSPVHSFGRTQTNPILHEMMPDNEVWVNAHVARRFGLADNARVRLRNQDGVLSDPVRLKVTERIRPDAVYMVHGFGHTAIRLTRAYRKGASDVQLITRYETDPLMGGTGMNVNFVTIEAEA
jgi:thiosulfate reductase/polysulfide reductase chain A